LWVKTDLLISLDTVLHTDIKFKYVQSVVCFIGMVGKKISQGPLESLNKYSIFQKMSEFNFSYLWDYTVLAYLNHYFQRHVYPSIINTNQFWLWVERVQAQKQFLFLKWDFTLITTLQIPSSIFSELHRMENNSFWYCLFLFELIVKFSEKESWFNQTVIWVKSQFLKDSSKKYTEILLHISNIIWTIL